MGYKGARGAASQWVARWREQGSVTAVELLQVVAWVYAWLR
eukprot:gene38357-7248_t